MTIAIQAGCAVSLWWCRVGEQKLTLEQFISRLVHDLDSNLTYEQGKELYQEFVGKCPEHDFNKHLYTYSEWLEKYFFKTI